MRESGLRDKPDIVPSGPAGRQLLSPLVACGGGTRAVCSCGVVSFSAVSYSTKRRTCDAPITL